MAALSHDLAGVTLPHDSYRNHLDESGKTLDAKLEKKNFFKAAEVLSEIWSKTVIDGRPVDSQAVPLDQSFVPPTPDANWVGKHVRQTRFTLQIVKCQNQKCCEPFKTNWLDVFPDHFFPFPAVYKYESNGSAAVEPSEYIKNPRKYEFTPLTAKLLLKKSPDEAKAYVEVLFDIYCSSMKEKLDKGI